MTVVDARRCGGEQGATLVEFALVVPILVLLVSGVLEFGTAWRESLNLASAVRSGARQVSNSGQTRDADYLALQSFVATMGRAKNVTVDKVVIYRANSSGQPLSSTCLTGTPTASDDCNVYSATQLANLGATYATNFGGSTSCSSTAWDKNWCPLDRKDLQGDPPDYVGFWAKVTYGRVTALIPGSLTITDKAVMQIEPRVT